jgi:6-pyruvoyltetrahydropterin/6-carboxytetrahydropterin synthase
MSTTVAVRAYFHTAHRLPALAGKCASLHGHSWQAWFHLAGPVDPTGILADFGMVKDVLRGWCLDYLDHGTALGLADELVPALAERGTKLYLFGDDDAEGSYSQGLEWPTVENMACMLYRMAADLLPEPITVAAVEVQETENNRARFSPGA